MIEVKRSPTADTRTCDYRNVSKDTLLASSAQHITDVGRALAFFGAKLVEQAVRHDTDKLTDIDGFHRDFINGFVDPEWTTWWRKHREINRHHLNAPDGTPLDVNLIDVLDYIADCVMAGSARTGTVYPVTIDVHVLRQAFRNTVELLQAQVVLVDGAQAAEEGK